MMNYEETERLVHERHQQYKVEAVEKAKGLAAMERPTTKEEALLYVREIRARYQGLARVLNALMRPLTNRAAGAVDSQLATLETSDSDKEIAAKAHRLNVHRMDNPQGRGSISVPLKAILVIVMTLIALGAESLWLSGVFQVTGESSRARATWIALGVTIIMGTLAHTTVFAVRKLKRRPWQIATILVSLAVAAVVYYVLGSLRARYLSEVLEHGEGLMTSPWMFTVLSLAVYVAIGAFSLFFFPSLDEIEEYRTHRKEKRELRAKEAELEAMKADRKTLPRRFAQKIEARAGIVESADALKRALYEMHRETYFLFAQTNSMRRMTTPPPELFGEPDDLDLNER